MSNLRALAQPRITRAVLICLVLLLSLIVLPGIARPPQDKPSEVLQKVQDEDAVKLSIDLVVLHATVKSRKRAFVSGLGKADFQVYEDRALQQIDSFSHEDIPVTVGLVVDNSGSMRPKRAEVNAAALAFARSSNPLDQIFVVNFNENVVFVLPDGSPFTDNVAQLEVALYSAVPDGMTALYDAVAAALDHLEKGDRDKKVLIVISDGGDNSSLHNRADILAMAQKSDAIIYTVGLFDEHDPDRDPGTLKQLASATGGEAFFPESIKHIVSTCERIAHDIRNQYTITYVPTNTDLDGKYRVITVKAAASGHGRLSVRTRAGYVAPLKP